MAIDTIKATAILDGSVDTADLADNAVTTAKITDGNVTSAKIGDGEVTSAKLDTNIDIAGTLDVTGVATLDDDLNVDSGTLFVDASANSVGIGTASPSAPLNVSYSNSSRDDTLLLTNTNTGGYGPWISFYGNYNGGYSFGSIGGENQSTGGTLTFKTADTSGTLQENLQVTNNGDLRFRSGFGSLGVAYGCRAWVYFNGTGTVAINGSGNVSSVTDNGAGDYFINFTSSMPDTNYCIQSGQSNSLGASNVYYFNYNSATLKGTAGFRAISYYDAGTTTAVDRANLYVAVFR